MIAVYDPPNQYQFSPIVEIRRAGSGQVLTTIMTREAFITKWQSSLALDEGENGSMSVFRNLCSSDD